MSTKLPREITKPLRALLGRVRRMQILRGLAALATVLLGGVLLSMAAHLVFAPLPLVMSWILLGSIVGAALWAFWTWFVKPLRSRIDLVQIARWLETRHPEIQERVSTALELSSDSSGGVSEALLKELVLEAQGDVREVDPTVEVRARRAKRWLWPAAGLTAVFVLVFVVFPGEAQRLLVRAVAPFSDLGNAGAVRFTIDPENIEVLEGDEVKITIRYSDSEAELLSLIMEREGEETLTETLKRAGMEDGVSRFEYRLPAAKDSFHYFAQFGKAQSDGYDVTVAPLPRIQEVEVAVDSITSLIEPVIIVFLGVVVGGLVVALVPRLLHFDLHGVELALDNYGSAINAANQALQIAPRYFSTHDNLDFRDLHLVLAHSYLSTGTVFSEDTNDKANALAQVDLLDPGYRDQYLDNNLEEGDLLIKIEELQGL